MVSKHLEQVRVKIEHQTSLTNQRSKLTCGKTTTYRYCIEYNICLHLESSCVHPLSLPCLFSKGQEGWAPCTANCVHKWLSVAAGNVSEAPQELDTHQVSKRFKRDNSSGFPCETSYWSLHPKKCDFDQKTLCE